jgi:type I restriction enzyme S subunit
VTNQFSTRQLISFAIGGGWGDDVSKDGSVEVRVIRGTDLPRVTAGDFSSVPLRFETERKVEKRLLHVGDIILEAAGGSSAKGQYTGRTLIITKEILDELGPTIPASFCKRISLNQEVIDPWYFYFAMQDMWNSGRIAKYDSQSTGISNFQFESFLDDEIWELPSLEEQVAKVQTLKAIHNRIFLNGFQSGILTSYKNLLMPRLAEQRADY